MGKAASGQIMTIRVCRKQRNGDRYVFEEQKQYNPQKQRYDPIKGSSTCLGKMKPGSNDKYDLIPLRPRRKSEVKPTDSAVQPNNNRDSIQVTRTSTGMTELLAFLTADSLIEADLKKVIPTDVGLRQKLVTLSWYNCSTNGATWPGVRSWSLEHYGAIPYSYTLFSQDMYHDVFAKLGSSPEIKLNLFKERVDHCKAMNNGELLLALDSTSIVAYTVRTGVCRKGIHKDGQVHTIFKIVFFYAIGMHLPIAYVIIPGNIPDTQTVHMALTVLRSYGIGIEDAEMIDDAGYCTDETLCIMLSEGQHFITRIESDISWIVKIIDNNREEIINGEFLECDPKFSGMAFKHRRTFSRRKRAGDPEDTCYSYTGNVNVFIYYSTSNRAKDEAEFRKNYNLYKKMLLTGVELGDQKTEIMNFSKKYMIVDKDADGNIIKITRNNEAYSKKSKYFGFLVLVADKETSLERCLVKFRSRVQIEIDIRNFKSYCDGDHMRAWSETTLDGYTLAKFISLTIKDHLEHKIEAAKDDLGIKNNDPEHDKAEKLTLERKLLRWLEQTSTVEILKWFDAVRRNELSANQKAYEVMTPYSQRDELFLSRIGYYEWKSGESKSETDDSK